MHLTAQNKTEQESIAHLSTLWSGDMVLPIMLTKHGSSFLSGKIGLRKNKAKEQ